MSVKKIKDPIYGYIEIDEDIMRNIIDSDTFQRLRDIRATSYSPLYPASLSNRFVHSLGVYYLGKIAFEALNKSADYYKEKNHEVLGTFEKEKFERYRYLFELACLLHDIGHSPFSHTGEEFYLNSKSKKRIHINAKAFIKESNFAVSNKTGGKTSEEEKREKIKQQFKNNKYTIQKHLTYLTNDADFLLSSGNNPAPHEIMSCIVTLEKFGYLFKSIDEKSFFARCITGILYKEVLNIKADEYYSMEKSKYHDIMDKLLRNCFINLLHSPVIDVDRLDYIIRDAITMGYQNVSVDYKRLLNGIVFVMLDNYNFTIGFHKNAISVIENAVYAHDNEKNWVQRHPTILYESYLLHRCITYIEGEILKDFPNAKSSLFSYDSLTSEGSNFKKMHVRYLGDADIIHLMKNVYFNNQYSKEYFNRNLRPHPLWKSEAEFLNFFSKDERNAISEVIQQLMMGDQHAEGFIEINDTFIDQIKDDENERYPLKKEINKKKKKYANALLKICDKYKIKRNIVFLSTSFFKSNFSREDISKIPVFFPDGRQRCILSSVSNVLSCASPKDEIMYYLFYYPKRIDKEYEKLDIKGFTGELKKCFCI